MPQTKNKKKGKAARSKNKAANPGGSARGASVALASTSGLRSEFKMSHARRAGTDVIRIHIRDQISVSDGIAVGGIKADAIPFTLANNSPYLSRLGQILPKLQGFARVCGRYQVLNARVHHQSLSNAAAPISVGLAIVPGLRSAVGSLAELASFAHSAVMPAWQNGASDRWVNAESRWFSTNDSFAASADPSVAFTILRCYDASLLASQTALEGLVWLEMDIEFIDLQPAAQALAAMTVATPSSGAQTVTGGNAPAGQMVAFGAAKAMEGLFDWYFDSPSTFSLAGTPTVTTKTGTSLVADAGSDLDWWLDLVLGAATLTEASGTGKQLQQWCPSDGEVKEDWVGAERSFPRPWTPPHRMRIIAAFRSLKEARAAAAAGFDPDRIIREGPNAAGDVTSYLYAQPLQAGADIVLLYSAVHSAGTGAIQFQDQHQFDLDVPAKLFTLVKPTGVENRVIGATTQMEISC